MAELAHDATGPASSEPTRIAPQQASGPTSSDKEKLRVFISYSRDDLDFADQLDAALYDFECLIDRHGISGGEDWKRRLGNLISEADTVVFVLSPSSARSEICVWEVEEAARLNKRILPVISRPLEGVNPPPRLRDLNYMFFYAEPKVPGSGFGTGLANLVAALNTDFDWLREHTRYLQRAMEWDKGARPANRLLSGNDILDAKAWVARRPKGAPEPTALQLEFIRASEEEAEARLSEQRKQLEAVATAQAERETALHEAEEALQRAAEAQRRRTRIRNIAFVAVSGLAAVALLFAWTADRQSQQADELVTRSMRLIVSLPDMESKPTPEVFELLQAGANHGSVLSMGLLGALYTDGLTVAQDYAKAREWFKKAADKGDAGGMQNLGSLYANGRGVAQDYAKAREWFKKAADKNNTDAMVGLGMLYHEGYGVPQDYVKAREWYEKAAAKGHKDVEVQLAKLSMDEAQTTGRYAEALRHGEDLVAILEAVETKRDGKPGRDTALALYDVAWSALSAREFPKAFSASDRSHTLLPQDLSIETTRAHALMFIGRGDEAKALYLAHKGQPMSDNKLWEQAIAADFENLRKAGLTHPMMADIEKELGIAR